MAPRGWAAVGSSLFPAQGPTELMGTMDTLKRRWHFTQCVVKMCNSTALSQEENSSRDVRFELGAFWLDIRRGLLWGYSFGMDGLRRCCVNLCFSLPSLGWFVVGLAARMEVPQRFSPSEGCSWAPCSSRAANRGFLWLGASLPAQRQLQSLLIPQERWHSFRLWCLRSAQQSQAYGSSLHPGGISSAKPLLGCFLCFKGFLYSKVLKHPSLEILIILTQSLSFK